MPRSDPGTASARWQTWFALAWATAAGVLYARMLFQVRAAEWAGLLRRIFG